MNIEEIRAQFPILATRVYNKALVYLDNGATTQKPLRVIETIADAYRTYNSNIHRGVHYLSDVSSDRYEKARREVAQFINARSDKEIIFTAGTTASINLLAFSFGEKYIEAGDEIIISALEHHANIVPWQMMCERKGAKLVVIPADDKGRVMVERLESMISPLTKLISVTQASNSLGTITDIEGITAIASKHGIPVMVDGAQGIQHGQVDVQAMKCDFYVFSGHKAYGPTGIGVLYGREKWLDELPPYQGGGDMVDRVTFEKTTYNELPFKFEAGTTNFVGAIGMSEALGYMSDLGISAIAERESMLLEYATSRLKEIDGMVIYGDISGRAPIISFNIEGIHHYDAGMILDKMGIAVRTGTHCAQPVMERFGIEGTIRASFSFYNTTEEIDALAEGLIKVKELMG